MKASRFAKLIDMHAQIVGSLLYLRFEFTTGDAAGHNMVTLASDRMLDWILNHYPVCVMSLFPEIIAVIKKPLR